jgi:predicted ATPase
LIRSLHIQGYRSIRDLTLDLAPLNVVVGPNACGKSNLYRALALLAAAAEGRLARTFADEGGMASALWAGERKRGPARLSIEVTSDDFAYELSCGLPSLGDSAFRLDPEVKRERLWLVNGAQRTVLLERDGTAVFARDAAGERVTYPFVASSSESVFAELREPHRFPALFALRGELERWRFYHHLRTDAGSALRSPQVGVRTAALAQNGSDLAAALQTIRETGDADAMRDAVTSAFPGAELVIRVPSETDDRRGFAVALQMPEFHRPFEARELSDGTLHYLCLVAVLLSPRPPPLLVLNEPEQSVHPDLLDPLARMIVRAVRDVQIVVVTHSPSLADSIEKQAGVAPIRLEKIAGQTRIAAVR